MNFNYRRTDEGPEHPTRQRLVRFLVLVWMAALLPLSVAQETATSMIWKTNAGVFLTFGTTDIEVKPYIQSTFSADVAPGIGLDAGIISEFYIASPRHGVEEDALGGSLSTYLGFGLITDKRLVYPTQPNALDVRTFSGRGPSVNSFQAGYGVTQWFGGFPATGDWTLTSRAGSVYLSYNDGPWTRARLIYGNDDLPLGDSRDSNESAFGSFEIGNNYESAEIGFYNVTDQVLYGSKEEVDPRFKLPNRVSVGYRLVGEPFADKERGLGTSLTTGPGVENHVVFLGYSSSFLEFRLGVEGKLAYDVTQGLIHNLLGYHALPHKDDNNVFLETGLDISYALQDSEVYTLR